MPSANHDYHEGGTAVAPFSGRSGAGALLLTCSLWLLSALSLHADVVAAPMNLPSAAPSLLRVLGALSLVLGLFLTGAWLLRNGRIFALRRGKATRLQVLESRSLGGKHGLFVVGYEDQRFLLGSSPAGIQMLSHLPSGIPEEAQQPQAQECVTFAQSLAQILRRPGSSGAQCGKALK